MLKLLTVAVLDIYTFEPFFLHIYSFFCVFGSSFLRTVFFRFCQLYLLSVAVCLVCVCARHRGCVVAPVVERQDVSLVWVLLVFLHHNKRNLLALYVVTVAVSHHGLLYGLAIVEYHLARDVLFRDRRWLERERCFGLAHRSLPCAWQQVAHLGHGLCGRVAILVAGYARSHIQAKPHGDDAQTDELCSLFP